MRGIKDGSIQCLAVDTPVPSQFAHELLNANPYAFLDEAGLEERRTRAVSLNSSIPPSVLEQPGKLDPEAITTVRSQCWPDIRDHHELHDLLMSLVVLPCPQSMMTAPNIGRSSTTASNSTPVPTPSHAAITNAGLLQNGCPWYILCGSTRLT